MAVPCINGKILFVDLTNQKTEERPITNEMIESKMCYNQVPGGVLGKEWMKTINEWKSHQGKRKYKRRRKKNGK